MLISHATSFRPPLAFLTTCLCHAASVLLRLSLAIRGEHFRLYDRHASLRMLMCYLSVYVVFHGTCYVDLRYIEQINTLAPKTPTTIKSAWFQQICCHPGIDCAMNPESRLSPNYPVIFLDYNRNERNASPLVITIVAIFFFLYILHSLGNFLLSCLS